MSEVLQWLTRNLVDARVGDTWQIGYYIYKIELHTDYVLRIM
jgi:hypothetical protein